MLCDDDHDEDHNKKHYQLDSLIAMLTPTVFASPEETAYLTRNLLNCVDVSPADFSLNSVDLKFFGDNFCSLTTIELSLILNFMLKSGLDPQHQLLKPAINLLNYKWNYDVFSSSSQRSVDANSTAVAITVLKQAGYSVSFKSLLNFFNGRYFQTFHDETTPSIIVNLNALNVFRFFKCTDDPKVVDIIASVLDWIDTMTSVGQLFIADSVWNVSPFYSTSLAVFSLLGLRNDIVDRCLKLLINSQNEDGGWGSVGRSTVEETAYVSLALCFSIDNGYRIDNRVVEAAARFLNDPKQNCEKEAFWNDKMLNHQIIIAEIAVWSARFALNRLLKQQLYDK